MSKEDNSIKLCPKCKEIMYFDYSGLTDTNTYLVKCMKCGLTEKVKIQNRLIPTPIEEDEIIALHDCISCKQKDQRIAELEKEVEYWAEQYQSLGKEDFEREEKLKNEVNQLKHDLAVRDKALDLIKEEGLNLSISFSITFFLEQAEEELKGGEDE